MKRAALALAALLAALPALAGNEEVFEKAFSMEGVPKVSVENVNGRVEAIAWDRNYLRVKAVKTARGGSSEDVLKQTEIRVSKVGDRIEIVTISPQRRRLFGFLEWGHRLANVDYELHIPVGAEGKGETTNGKGGAGGVGGGVSAGRGDGGVDRADTRGTGRGT